MGARQFLEGGDTATDQPLIDASCAPAVWSYDQKKSFYAAERDRPDVQVERREFQELMKLLPLEKLVFIDESGCNLAMASFYGWAPRGHRAVGPRPFNHGKNITVIGAIRLSGPVCHRKFVGALNEERFVQFARRDLSPRLEADDIVVLDNLSSHYAPEALDAIEQRGAFVLFLPPYSPDLNPIEKVWFPFKNILRKLAIRARDELLPAITRTWRRMRNIDYSGLLKACGYA